MKTIMGLAASMLVLFSLSVNAKPAYKLPKPGTFKTPDNDTLLFSVKDGKAGKITFCLSTARDVTWWKGIKIFGNNTSTTIGLIATQDQDHGPSCRTIATGEFQEGASRLEFWKAKSLGVHSDIVHYKFTPSQYHGKTLDFLWQKD